MDCSWKGCRQTLQRIVVRRVAVDPGDGMFIVDSPLAVITLNHMVKCSADRLDTVFRAMADPTRRRILAEIARASWTVAEISRPFRISPPAISRHLRLLEDAGLVRRIRDGKFHRFELQPQAIIQAGEMLQRLALEWVDRIDRLEAFLEKEAKSARTGA
jgi:DNA-binding transcriptional ArsR family regulator